MFVGNHFLPLADPADGARNGKQYREHRCRKSHGAQNNPRVEVNVGVELARDEILIRQGNAFQFLRHFKQWIISNTQSVEHFIGSLLHDLGAWVVVLVNAMAKTHQLHVRRLVFHLFDEGRNFINTADF